MGYLGDDGDRQTPPYSDFDVDEPRPPRRQSPTSDSYSFGRCLGAMLKLAK